MSKELEARVEELEARNEELEEEIGDMQRSLDIERDLAKDYARQIAITKPALEHIFQKGDPDGYFAAKALAETWPGEYRWITESFDAMTRMHNMKLTRRNKR
jgi:hypothetical protein